MDNANRHVNLETLLREVRRPLNTTQESPVVPFGPEHRVGKSRVLTADLSSGNLRAGTLIVRVRYGNKSIGWWSLARWRAYGREL